MEDHRIQPIYLGRAGNSQFNNAVFRNPKIPRVIPIHGKNPHTPGSFSCNKSITLLGV